MSPTEDSADVDGSELRRCVSGVSLFDSFQSSVYLSEAAGAGQETQNFREESGVTSAVPGAPSNLTSQLADGEHS